ncbi:hypothetical protein [Allofrancisella frigidaquae]|uniref:Uncharacterized protein n=1 Tax=Allofrancisella frigidaquae TaxID=1085644 RepID=A0A6M3HTL1_9GAMM|nr:hypothetical protein [Allofrancisella frigidaquae]QIV94535.1 hypothetical protein E3E15_03850 [Allofrancisella frigidaquae]
MEYINKAKVEFESLELFDKTKILRASRSIEILRASVFKMSEIINKNSNTLTPSNDFMKELISYKMMYLLIKQDTALMDEITKSIQYQRLLEYLNEIFKIKFKDIRIELFRGIETPADRVKNVNDRMKNIAASKLQTYWRRKKMKAYEPLIMERLPKKYTDEKFTKSDNCYPMGEYLHTEGYKGLLRRLVKIDNKELSKELSPDEEKLLQMLLEIDNKELSKELSPDEKKLLQTLLEIDDKKLPKELSPAEKQKLQKLVEINKKRLLLNKEAFRKTHFADVMCNDTYSSLCTLSKARIEAIKIELQEEHGMSKVDIFKGYPNLKKLCFESEFNLKHYTGTTTDKIWNGNDFILKTYESLYPNKDCGGNSNSKYDAVDLGNLRFVFWHLQPAKFDTRILSHFGSNEYVAPAKEAGLFSYGFICMTEQKNVDVLPEISGNMTKLDKLPFWQDMLKYAREIEEYIDEDEDEDEGEVIYLRKLLDNHDISFNFYDGDQRKIINRKQNASGGSYEYPISLDKTNHIASFAMFFGPYIREGLYLSILLELRRFDIDGKILKWTEERLSETNKDIDVEFGQLLMKLFRIEAHTPGNFSFKKMQAATKARVTEDYGTANEEYKQRLNKIATYRNAKPEMYGFLAEK